MLTTTLSTKRKNKTNICNPRVSITKYHSIDQQSSVATWSELPLRGDSHRRRRKHASSLLNKLTLCCSDHFHSDWTTYQKGGEMRANQRAQKIVLRGRFLLLSPSFKSLSCHLTSLTVISLALRPYCALEI